MCEVCIFCGEERDMSPRGMVLNLSVDDDGEAGGLGRCGNSHTWTPVGNPSRLGAGVEEDDDDWDVELRVRLMER